jgi:hypothetical protein
MNAGILACHPMSGIVTAACGELLGVYARPPAGSCYTDGCFYLSSAIGGHAVTQIKWVICCAVIMAATSATIVQAQEDDLFGPPSAGENRNPESGNPKPTRAPDDLFGNPYGIAPNAPRPANERSQPASGVLDDDPFEPAAPTVQTPTPGVAAKSRDDFCKCEGENRVATAQIEGALSSTIGSPGLDFADSPLEEVVGVLQHRFGIPIQFDTPALDQNGISPDVPVAVSVRKISVQSALRLILRPLQLAYVIEDEVLMITTLEEANSRITVCVYDVRDLVDGKQSATIKDLADVITTSIRPEMWNNSKGRIRSYAPNLLVIAQTQAVHKQIRDLLQTMRTMRQASRVEGKAAKE